MKSRTFLGQKIAIVLVVVISISSAKAHVSEQGIVLLLPTDIYILTGCFSVIASMLVVSLLPHDSVFLLFKPIRIKFPTINLFSYNSKLKDIISIMSLCLVVGLVVVGAIGSRDPLVNILPLTIWTIWWIAIVVLHSLFGNIWSWINPWTGFYNQMFQGTTNWLALPKQLGHWPAILLFIAFYIFVIADLAPDDPARLSNVVLAYLMFTFIGMFVFGSERWLTQVECFTVLFQFLSRLSPIQINPNEKVLLIGLPGWKAVRDDSLTLSQALFLLSMLASGSFDGVNETFWWLGQININPLAFPGRSAVIMESSLGMLAANLLLYGVFAGCVWIGIKIVQRKNFVYQYSTAKTQKFTHLFSALTISILPIAAVYHASHYMTTFMVNGQYFIAALSDPLANGSNYLGLENFQVTTGYLNDVSSVRAIWLSQAGIVIFGHIIAVLMAHYAIAKRFSDRQDAIFFHIPLAIFMAGYTWFGLWLLAAPKGA